MNQVSIIVICVLSILLWYYYMKSNEYNPLILNKLRDNNLKLKTKIKHLENYKNDVSKTFKILDNELVLINEHIHDNKTENSFQTSVTPNLLNNLLSPENGTFNSIFNQFLTGDINFEATITEPEIQIENIMQTNIDIEKNSIGESLEYQEPKLEELQISKIENEQIPESHEIKEISAFNTNYKQYLI